MELEKTGDILLGDIRIDEPENGKPAQDTEPLEPPAGGDSQKPAQDGNPVPPGGTVNGNQLMDLAATLLADMPEARPDAPPPPNPQAATGPVPVKGKTDRYGNGFDPVYHESNPDGTPKLNRDGYIANKRGKKPPMPGVQVAAGTTPAPAGPSKEDLEMAQAAATVLVGSVLSICVMKIGDEWQASGSEFTQLTKATAEVIQSNELLTKASPEWKLALVGFAFAAPRLMHKNTQEKLQPVWVRAKIWISGLWIRMTSRPMNIKPPVSDKPASRQEAEAANPV